MHVDTIIDSWSFEKVSTTRPFVSYIQSLSEPEPDMIWDFPVCTVLEENFDASAASSSQDFIAMIR